MHHSKQPVAMSDRLCNHARISWIWFGVDVKKAYHLYTDKVKLQFVTESFGFKKTILKQKKRFYLWPKKINLYLNINFDKNCKISIRKISC